MLSIGRMAMLSGPVMFMGIDVLMATGWAMFMADAVAGMLTEAMLTGAVMVTGCCRVTGAVRFNVLEEMVMGLLIVPRFMLAVLAVAEAVTGVAEAELHVLVVSEWVLSWFDAATTNEDQEEVVELVDEEEEEEE